MSLSPCPQRVKPFAAPGSEITAPPDTPPKFASRVAAELRAHTLQLGQPLGTDVFAYQIEGRWCVCQSVRGATTIIEA